MLLGSSNSNFLIPNGTFIAELIMFIVVLGITAKFVLPALTGAMNQRAETIKAAQQASDEGREEADRLVAQRLSVLEAAREQARLIMDEVSHENEELLEQARERGRRERERLVAAAATEIDAERDRARDGVLVHFSELVMSAAGQVIGSPVDASRHRGLLDDAIADAGAGTGGRSR